MTPRQPRKRNAFHLTALAISSVAALTFILMFALANSDWIVVRLPTAPWSASPSNAAFEARSFAIMLTSFALGATVVSLLWRHAFTALKRRFQLERAHAESMESELAALGRLVSSERDRRQTDASTRQTGDAN
jgi:hypothetical protein